VGLQPLASRQVHQLQLGLDDLARDLLAGVHDQDSVLPGGVLVEFGC
jgi:hypothetical protein